MSARAARSNAFIGRQIAAARKDMGLTQEQLSERLNFNDRQILSNIEKGHRKVKKDEWPIFMKELNRSFDYFTDMYQLPDDQLFSWRAKTNETDKEILAKEISRSESMARGVVAANRRFSELTNRHLELIIPRLAVSHMSSYEEVADTGEFLASYWKMGEIPAKELTGLIKETLNIDLFYLDFPNEVSGSSVSTDEFCAIFINRMHSEGRRNFSLGHELFHILTWQTFHPEQFAPEEWENAKNRSEKLADNFSSGLLMPRSILMPFWKKFDGKNLTEWLNHTSRGLSVSADALFWRLVNLGELSKKDKPDGLYAPHADEDASFSPRPYSEHFVEMMCKVLDQGLVSAQKCASLLNCSFDDMYDVFNAYDLNSPFKL